MIHGLQLVNIGCHTHTALTFGRLTAIVGQNGTGKTTVLRAIQLIEAMALAPQNPTSLRELWVRDNCEETDESLLSGVFYAQPDEYEKKVGVKSMFLTNRFEVESKEDQKSASFLSNFRSTGWNISFHKSMFPPIWALDHKTWFERCQFYYESGNHTVRQNESENSNPWGDWNGEEGPFFLRQQDFKSPLRARMHVGDSHYLKVTPHQLRAASYTPEIKPFLAPDASNLASVLADLMTSNRDAFNAILKALQGVVPSVLDIRATRCPVVIREATSVTVNKREIPYHEERTVPGYQLRFDTVTGSDLPASSISDGTLYALALVTLLVTSSGMSLILIDDVEAGLHPEAQRALVRQIKQLQKQHGDFQAILTTHSPYVVDELNADQVWLLHQNGEEGVSARKLSEHPRAKEALEVLTTGEFWTSEGEAWVSEQEKVEA